MSGKAILKEIGSTLLYIVVVLGITWLVITFVGQRTEVVHKDIRRSRIDKDIHGVRELFQRILESILRRGKTVVDFYELDGFFCGKIGD